MKNLTATICLTIAVFLAGCASPAKTTQTVFEDFRQLHMSTILKNSHECVVAVTVKEIEKYTAAFPNWTSEQVGNQLWNTNPQGHVSFSCGATARLTAVEHCKTATGGHCVVAFSQQANDLPRIVTSNILLVMTSFEAQKREQEELKVEQEKRAEMYKEQEELKAYRETCSKFGFKSDSSEMSKCTFDLYKLKRSKSQAPTVIQNNSGDNSAVRALLEEQQRQRQLEGSLELMQRGLDMMNPPKPRITCKYNQYTKTTVCN
jgi:hypothetical protein